MKLKTFLVIFAISGITAIVLLLAPSVGLGEKYDFVLYRSLGLSRSSAMWWLLWLTVFFVLIANLRIIRSHLEHVSWHELWPRLTNVVQKPAGFWLFLNEREHAHREEWIGATACAMCFAFLFFILLAKNIHGLRDFFDMHWHQAYLDYDLEWRTPVFSLGGNLLNNFGIQVPFNTSLSPFLGLSHVISPRQEFIVSICLFYAVMSALFWAIGGTVRLRPIVRAITAGTVALIGTIPFGIDVLLPFIPPYLFISQATLTRGYWEEVTILSLGASYLFLCLGRHKRSIVNTLFALAFAALAYIVLLSFPANAFFSVPVIALYCCAFLATSENANEFWWKLGASGALALSMLLLQLPAFFHNLYSYSFGAYFSDLMMRWPTKWQLFRSSSMAFVDSYDIRVPVIIGTSLITALILSVHGGGPLRRLAIGLLACEAGIVIMGLINALVFQDPLSLNYAEQIHAPLLIFMFILFMLFAGTRLILTLKEVGCIVFEQITCSPMLFWIPRYRTIAFALPWTIFLAMSLTIPKWSWTSYEYPPYPPAQPPSVKLLQQEIGLAPGKEFRGRLLVLLGQDVPGSNLSTLLGYLIGVGRDSYGRYLGNDHWVDLFPFNIPIINEYAHWTSPVSFVILRAFFGRREDVFEKALFVLRSFHPNVARMMGVRMIVTESPSVSGAILAYETMGGGVPLRIFRLDKVNVGQYSPTRPIRIANAAEAIEVLSHDSFVAERDVLTEDEIPDGLVAGKLISLTTNLGPTLRVHAVSSGRSILVLPFEYSKCLRLNAMPGNSSRLIPVNLQQTGLLFEGETELEISYRFGPLDQPRCRREDLKRIDRLQLRNAF